MDFSHISTMDEWSSALKELVDKARTADTHEKRIGVSIELTDYQVASTAPDPLNADQRATIRQFDRIAREISERVLIEDIGERNREIARQAGELAGVTKAFRERAEKNLRDADALKLNPIKRAITGANNLVESLMAVKDGLAGGEDAEKLRKRLESLVKSIQEMRNALKRNEASPG